MPEKYVWKINFKNARILLDSCPKKINKIPEFYMIFARKMLEFYICPKNIFPRTLGGTCLPCPHLLCLWLSQSSDRDNMLNCILCLRECINLALKIGLYPSYQRCISISRLHQLTQNRYRQEFKILIHYVRVR